MKKLLLAYTINNKIVGIDLQQWHISDGSSAFKLINSGDTIPTNYVNISSIVNWNQFGNIVANDYLVYKNTINDICNQKRWSGLTNTEKDIAIQYYSYPDSTSAVAYLMTVKGMSQPQAQEFLLLQWHKHHGNLMNACKLRWYYVKLIAITYLSFEDVETLLSNIQLLILLYVTVGRIGINYGDVKEGIMDYIESTNIYLNNGLRETKYTLLTGTYNDFIQALKNVIVEGIYNKYTDVEIL
jgi:hypothetical protein